MFTLYEVCACTLISLLLSNAQDQRRSRTETRRANTPAPSAASGCSEAFEQSIHQICTFVTLLNRLTPSVDRVSFISLLDSAKRVTNFV